MLSPAAVRMLGGDALWFPQAVVLRSDQARHLKAHQKLVAVGFPAMGGRGKTLVPLKVRPRALEPTWDPRRRVTAAVGS